MDGYGYGHDATLMRQSAGIFPLLIRTLLAMASTLPPTPTESKTNASKAISAGADLFVALFEAERAKIMEAVELPFRTLEAQFRQYRVQTEARLSLAMQQCGEATMTARKAEEERAAAQAAELRVRGELRELQSRYAVVMMGIRQMKSSLVNGPVSTKDNKVPILDSDVKQDVPDAAGATLYPATEVQKQVEDYQTLAAGYDRKLQTTKKERDELKAVTGGEVLILKDRIVSLQTEIDTLKTADYVGFVGDKNEREPPKGEYIVHVYSSSIVTSWHVDIRNRWSLNPRRDPYRTFTAGPDNKLSYLRSFRTIEPATPSDNGRGSVAK